MEFYEFLDALEILKELVPDFDETDFKKIQDLININFDKNLNVNEIEFFINKKISLDKNREEYDLIYNRMLFL